MIETYATIFMTKALLFHMPKIPILVKMNSKNLVADHFSLQLLNALGINSTALNIVPLGPQEVTFVTKFLIRNFFKENNAVAHAPYIITPLSLYCQYVSRGTLRRMRLQLAQSLPSIWNPQSFGDASYEERTILLYFDADAWRLKFEEARSDSKQRIDAKQQSGNFRRKRRAAAASIYSEQLFKALQSRYDSRIINKMMHSERWTVKAYLGNESFVDSVQLFRSTSIFIATHGKGMSNILFMVRLLILI